MTDEYDHEELRIGDRVANGQPYADEKRSAEEYLANLLKHIREDGEEFTPPALRTEKVDSTEAQSDYLYNTHKGHGHSLATSIDAQTGRYGKVPMLVIQWDDWPRDSTDVIGLGAFDVHESYGVPGEVVTTGEFDEDDPPFDESLEEKIRQTQELEKAGWNVPAHGYRHAGLHRDYLTEPASEGDTTIEVNSANRLDELYEYEIWDQNDGEHGDGEVIDIVDRDDDTVTLAEPLENDYPATDGRLQLTHESARQEVRGVKELFREYGITCNHYVGPHNTGDNAVARGWLSTHYDTHGVRDDAVHTELDSSTRFAIGRFNFEEQYHTESEIEDWLGEIVANDGFGVGYSHEPQNHDRLEFLIEAAQERDIQIVTLNEVVEAFGNYTQYGEFEFTQDGHLRKDQAVYSDISFYVADDFSDGKLTDRDGQATGPYYPHHDPTNSRLTGYYRPHWSRRPTVEDGYITDFDSQEAQRDHELNFGTWEIDVRLSDADDRVQYYFIRQDSNNAYWLEIRDDVTYIRYEQAGGSTTNLLSGDGLGDTNIHTLSVERRLIDADTHEAEFVLYIDGDEMARDTHEFDIESNNIRILQDTGSGAEVHRILSE